MVSAPCRSRISFGLEELTSIGPGSPSPACPCPPAASVNANVPTQADRGHLALLSGHLSSPRTLLVRLRAAVASDTCTYRLLGRYFQMPIIRLP